MPWQQAFGIAVLGALTVYLSLYRETRFVEFIKRPGRHWKILAFDLIVYLFCGGVVTLFVIEPKSSKEAFIGGCAWQGILGGVVAGSELKSLRNYVERDK